MAEIVSWTDAAVYCLVVNEAWKTKVKVVMEAW